MLQLYHKIEHLSTANIGGFLFKKFLYTVFINDTRGRATSGTGPTKYRQLHSCTKPWERGLDPPED